MQTTSTNNFCQEAIWPSYLYIGTNMSKYITFRVKILTTGQIVEWLAKDSIDAREGVADFYEVDYEQTKLI